MSEEIVMENPRMIRAVFRRSPRTGEMNSMVMAYSDIDYAQWENGTPIQVAMPYLSAEEREFLKTGLTQEDWDEIFGVFDDDSTWEDEACVRS